ncbi:MAG TPA: hypothetical protein ENH06_01155 [bacterium]|nr:hypothetical protein [bacterium]
MSKKVKEDYYNIVGGRIKKAKDDFENIIYFIERWENKIAEIKKSNLDNSQSYKLANDFLKEWDKFIYRNLKFGSLLAQLGHDLFLAITQANNNYKKQFPSFWQNFHKLKLPDLHFHKI